EELLEVRVAAANEGVLAVARQNDAALERADGAAHEHLAHRAVTAPGIRHIHPADAHALALEQTRVVFQAAVQALQVERRLAEQEEVRVLLPERVGLLLVWPDQRDLPQAADALVAAPALAPDALHLVEEVDAGKPLGARRLAGLVVGVVLERVVLD